MAVLRMLGIMALVILALVPFLFLLRRLVDWIGFPCKFCHATVRAFHHVPIADQESILEYFRDRELREVDRRGLFVCMNCRTVHDDFSGAKESRDVDLGGATAFCKVCNTMMKDCRPENEAIECPRCGTPYRWEVHRKSGFRFLMPPEGKRLMERFGGDGLVSVLPFQMIREPSSKPPQPRRKRD